MTDGRIVSELSYKSLSNSPPGIVSLADVIVIMLYSSVTFNQLSIGHCYVIHWALLGHVPLIVVFNLSLYIR